MPKYSRTSLALILVALVIAGVLVVTTTSGAIRKTRVTAYFDNSNGIFVGDEVRILGVPVGRIDAIEPQPDRAKITFWVNAKYQVPADAKAVLVSPSLVSARAVQLTPAYTGGPLMADNTVIAQDHTAVPVEWDDLRQQLQKLTNTLQPTQPGGVSTLGALVNTTADNLRGQGANLRDTLTKLSQAFSALGDHSKDTFSTVKNLAILVSALQSSTDLMRHLNQNLDTVTGLLANDPNELGDAASAVNETIVDVRDFLAENKDTVGTTSDKLTSVTTALNQSIDDIKQTLHITPGTFQNFLNIYQPAQGTLSGALAANNFSNPISFICGAIQAASRLNFEQSSKLCVQYLAPIIKNRQVNFPPLGENLFVGATARPNELTYSEDRLRPDYVPPAPPAAPSTDSPALPAEAPPITGNPAVAPPSAQPTNPDHSLAGLMMPPGGGS